MEKKRRILRITACGETAAKADTGILGIWSRIKTFAQNTAPNVANCTTPTDCGLRIKDPLVSVRCSLERRGIQLFRHYTSTVDIEICVRGDPALPSPDIGNQ